MLQPIAASQNSVSQQAPRHSDVPEAARRQLKTAEEAPGQGIASKIAISGRLTDMMVTSHSSDGLVLLAEMLSRMLGSERKDSETEAHYLRRLSGLLARLSPQMRALVEQLLNQRVEGLKLAFVIAALSDPSGPAAARLAARLEGTIGGSQDPATRSVVTLYQQNNGEGRANAVSSAAHSASPGTLTTPPQPETRPTSQAPSAAENRIRPQSQMLLASSLPPTTAAAGIDQTATALTSVAPGKAAATTPAGPDGNSGRSNATVDGTAEKPIPAPSLGAKPDDRQTSVAAGPGLSNGPQGEEQSDPPTARAPMTERSATAGATATGEPKATTPRTDTASSSMPDASPAKHGTGDGDSREDVSTLRRTKTMSDDGKPSLGRSGRNDGDGHPILQVLKGWQELAAAPPVGHAAAKPESALDQLIRSTLGKTASLEAEQYGMQTSGEADGQTGTVMRDPTAGLATPGTDADDATPMPGKSASHLLNLAASQAMALAEASGHLAEPELPTAIPLPVINYLFAQDEADRPVRQPPAKDEERDDDETYAEERDGERDGRDEGDGEPHVDEDASDDELALNEEMSGLEDLAGADGAPPAMLPKASDSSANPMPVLLAADPAAAGPEGLYWRMASLV